MPYIRPLDICVVVRDLYDSIEKTGIVVKCPVQISKVLLPAVSKKIASGYQISLLARNWNSRYMQGLLLRYQDKAEIIYSSSLNTCWRRFVVCKELAHLLIDTEQTHFTQDPVALVHELINDVPVMEVDDDVNSERWAMIAAIEMILPWCLRGQLNELSTEGLSDLQIAQQFRVPEKIVNLLLRSKYRDISAEANSFKAK
jgi:Zn-dependent peptidase ImmA (M78 family)